MKRETKVIEHLIELGVIDRETHNEPVRIL